jgi:hypothetical protein
VALPALNWKYVGSRSIASSISNALDAAYALGTATTYADGTARTPGTGSAWTWLREVSGVTVAIYGNPPTNALDFRYIIGGQVGAAAYPVLTPDSGTQVNTLVYGMNRSSGAYTSWSNAQPFTSGFSNYWRCTRAFSTIVYDTVLMWESQEGCAIQFAVASSGVTSSVQFGALFDPLSSAAGNCESDGRLYSMCGTGSGTTVPTNWLGTVNEGAWGEGNNSVAHGVHAGIFAPGTAVMFGGAGFQTKRFGSFALSSSTIGFSSLSGDVPRIPYCIASAAGVFLGQGRGIYMATRQTYSGATLIEGSTVVGYLYSASLTAPANGVLLGA